MFRNKPLHFVDFTAKSSSIFNSQQQTFEVGMTDSEKVMALFNAMNPRGQQDAIAIMIVLSQQHQKEVAEPLLRLVASNGKR